jgi:hypothetical protein
VLPKLNWGRTTQNRAGPFYLGNDAGVSIPKGFGQIGRQPGNTSVADLHKIRYLRQAANNASCDQMSPCGEYPGPEKRRSRCLSD